MSDEQYWLWLFDEEFQQDRNSQMLKAMKEVDRLDFRAALAWFEGAGCRFVWIDGEVEAHAQPHKFNLAHAGSQWLGRGNNRRRVECSLVWREHCRETLAYGEPLEGEVATDFVEGDGVWL